MFAVALAFTATTANAARILVVNYDFGPTVYDDMETNLEAAGHTVDQVDGTVGGNIATALGGGNYDQVFLFDLTSTLHLGGSDLSALSSFWDTSMGLVVDTRAYGYFFQGNDPSEVALLQNVAGQLDAAGGGVWIGTDHDPLWTNNGNAFLNSIGVDPIVGSFGDPVNHADPSSVLLSGVTVGDLWAAGETVGRAPLGVQPNGIEMFTHFGHVDGNGNVIPYISASFPINGVPTAETPEPGTVTFMLSGLAALAFVRRRRKK